MIEMNYAKGVDLSQGIEQFEINSNKELVSFVRSIAKNDDGETVYLYTDNCDYLEEEEIHLMTIIVTANPYDIVRRVSSIDFENETIHILHIHEYESFESAYKVALDMREVGRLCYDK